MNLIIRNILMKAYLTLILVTFPLLAKAAFDVPQNHLGDVNLFIGTANDYGQMTPGASVP